MEVWLIQNVIAPYRVPLFTEIAKSANFDFTLVLTAPKCRHRPHWNAKTEDVPFKVLTLRGWNIALSDDQSLSISLGLFASLIRRRPDVVVCNGFSLSTLLVFFYAKLFSKKYIVWSECTETTESVRRVGRLRTRVRRLLASGANAFIDAGSLSREYIRSLFPGDSIAPFFRSYNCVDRSLFVPRSEEEFINELTGSQSSQRILFVGRINMNKGIPMLLEVYKDLVSISDFPVDLVLVGEGHLEGYVREFKSENGLERIHLMSQVSYVEVAHYYQTCDVFVLLSLSDCNPLVIFEALHSGISIVCSDRAGNAPDFIVEGKNGYIVNPEDKDSIVQRVIEVLSWDSEKKRDAAEISRQSVKKANYHDSAKVFVEACWASMSE